MRKMCVSILLMFLILFAVGCGQSHVDKTTITVHKNGSVVNSIVEAFDKSYYDETKLQTEVEDSITEYNTAAGEKKVALSSFSVKENVARATIKYDSTEDYATFNQETLFVGTLAEAQKAGYDLNVDVVSVSSTSTIQKITALMENEELHVAIFSEDADLVVYGKVLYYSNGLKTGTSKKSVSVSDQTCEIYYVIF